MKSTTIVACAALSVMTAAAIAQTTVTTTGGTSGVVPVFTGNSTMGNSTITSSSTSVGFSTQVGIGTNSPTHPLDITWGRFGDNTGQLMIGAVNSAGAISFRRASDGFPLGFIGYLTGTESYNFQIVSSGGFGYMTFATSGNQERMRITNTGSVGIGTTTPSSSLEVNGTVTLTANSGGSIKFQDGTTQTTAWTGVLCGGDYAESVDVTGTRSQYAPGDVIVLDSAAPGHFLKSSEPYSTLVAGIYSTKPGAVGRRFTDLSKVKDEIPMAMIGIVPTKVSAENGSVKPGDLLVTSSTSGYAMKGTDRNRMTGAIVGKALGSVEKDTGIIEVLVTLQ